jgi:hypothetical protein
MDMLEVTAEQGILNSRVVRKSRSIAGSMTRTPRIKSIKREQWKKHIIK